MVSETDSLCDNEKVNNGNLQKVAHKDDGDTESMSSDASSDEGRTVVLDDDDGDDDDRACCHGNISVTNSRDVQFGNKTVYHGPVTIQQILCTNSNNNNKILTNGNKGVIATVNGGSIKPVTDLINDDVGIRGVDNLAFVGPTVNNVNCGAEVRCAEANDDHLRNNKGLYKGLLCLRKFCQGNFLLVGSLAMVMGSLIVVTVVLLTVVNPSVLAESKSDRWRGDSDEQEKNTPIDAPFDPDSNLTLPGKLKMVSRLEWLAQPPANVSDRLVTPVPYVIIHHTATENCSSQSQCIFHVRFIQTFHIESRHWNDIGYNFMVGGNGEAYEGRGWETEGAHCYGYNSRSIGIAFIGTFNSISPPERQIRACKLVIAKGVELGYIKKDYKLLGARQLQTTLSPGQVLYDEIKTWDHWAKEP